MKSALYITALLAALGVSQASTIVVPNANTSVNGNAVQFLLFGTGTTNEFQWQLAGSQLTSVVGDSLTGIGFRLAAGQASVPGPTTINMFNLGLSPSVNPIGALSTTFTDNIGPGAVTVLSGALSLGALTGGAGPNPFFIINFSTPYHYTGGDLVMTLNTSSNSTFAVDANTVDSLGDTVGSLNGGVAEFFNYPITEFQAAVTATVPEPASLLTMAAGILLLASLRSSRKSVRG
jgi:hypothetical protein